MRILVVGAGGVGGYFGGRLVQAGRDVTFLVRPRRAEELSSAGLILKSPHGDAVLKDIQTVQRDTIQTAFDVVLLSCKAYDLADAIESVRPAVGPQTSVIPLLNGMAHLDALDQAFGRQRVLGGLCAIAATLNPDREVVQMTPMQSLTFGEREQTSSPRVSEIAAAFETGKFNSAVSETIIHDMWEKWVFLASLGASTCLMQASIGHIVAAPGGSDFVKGVFEECRSISASMGYPVRPAWEAKALGMLTAEGSPLTASMFRDMAGGQRVEADHIIGDLIARGASQGLRSPLLGLAFTQLKAYEARKGLDKE